MISLNIQSTPLNNWSTGEVPTHDNNFGYKAVFNAVVEHLLKSDEGFGIVQPDIGQEKEVDIRKLLPNTTGIVWLDAD